jgi:hypothetical protein
MTESGNRTLILTSFLSSSKLCAPKSRNDCGGHMDDKEGGKQIELWLLTSFLRFG